MYRAISVAIALALTPATALAGNVFNSYNHSAEFIRTLVRNASTGVDAAAYNPAGTTSLEQGFHLGFTNQVVLKEDKLQLLGEDYIANNPVPLYPTLSAIYNSGNDWSLFLHLGVPSGGGSKDFTTGHPVLKAQEMTVLGMVNERAAAQLGEGVQVASAATFADGNVKGFSVFLSATLGGAYEFTDTPMGDISLAAGLRVVQGNESTTAAGSYDLTLTEVGQGVSDLGMLPNPIRLNVNSETTGKGWNPLVGVHWTPVDTLEIGINYQFKTPMQWTRTFPTDNQEEGVENVSGMFYPTDSYQKDIPALLALGLSYNLTPELRTEIGYTHYLNTAATWSYDLTDAEGNVTTVDEMAPFADGYEAGLAVEYDLGNFLVSVGGNYQKTGSTLESKSWLKGNLNSFSVAGGATWLINDTFDATIGLFNVNYFSQTKDLGTPEMPLEMTWNQTVMGGAVGVNAHF